MKDRPILFNDAMVRAILDGTKTQTRRPVTPQPTGGILGCEWYAPTRINRHGEEYPGKQVYGCYDDESGWVSPLGGPGAQLWVRECWAYTNDYDGNYLLEGRTALYRADGETQIVPSRWRPSIHMPRRKSRITLLVTDVRVERVQDISGDDVEAEGVDLSSEMFPSVNRLDKLLWRFQVLWDSIYAVKGYGWADNPWVWVATFNVINGGAR